MTFSVCLRCAVFVLLLAPPALAQHDHGAMAGARDESQSAATMSSRHLDMGAHMQLTALRPAKPGDQQRANDVLAGARKAAEHYRDYKVALADGFRIFLPNLPQKMYHFTNYEYGFESVFRLNPEHPTSLLYEKQSDGGYKLVGVMYTAPANSAPAELDSRVPLSVAQWHLHTNFCKAPLGQEKQYFGASPKFGLLGSIVDEKDCEAAGGSFHPHVFSWMVHVYPFEKTSAEIWSVERQMEPGEMAGHAH